MGSDQSIPQVHFKALTPKLVDTKQEVYWSNVCTLLNKSAYECAMTKQALHINEQIYWTGRVVRVQSGLLHIKMNPSIYEYVHDVELIVDTEIDHSALKNQIINFFGTIISVKDKVTIKYSHTKWYGPKQDERFNSLFKYYEHIGETYNYVQEVATLSWNEFLLDSCPTMFWDMFANFQRNPWIVQLKYDGTEFKSADGQQFQFSQVQSQIKPGIYEVVGQVERFNEQYCIFLAVCTINKIKQFTNEMTISNRITITIDQAQKMKFMLQSGQLVEKQLLLNLEQTSKSYNKQCEQNPEFQQLQKSCTVSQIKIAHALQSDASIDVEDAKQLDEIYEREIRRQLSSNNKKDLGQSLIQNEVKVQQKVDVKIQHFEKLSSIFQGDEAYLEWQKEQQQKELFAVVK
ncbi:Conserved_hypothetical protein [Hexamita inflata]|uniref:Uncharacterized protein n=1 Tax=Hexamita inflata TaxID=28002 RepID=A0ABP1HIT3_9EUKA